MGLFRRARRSAALIAAGAAAAYLLDPESGPQRRAELLRRAQALGEAAGVDGGDGSLDGQEPSIDPETAATLADALADQGGHGSQQSSASDDQAAGSSVP